MTSSSSSRIAAVRPLWAVEGGRIAIAGTGFAVDPLLPRVLIGGVPARLSSASATELAAIVPAGLEGGHTPVRIEEAPGETAYVEIGTPLATGLHQVDSPAFDAAGNLYVTFSGSRGQQGPVAIFVVRPDGSREPFVADLANPTSIAFSPEGRLHVSSRFDGTVHRVEADGRLTVVASELGVACGIAFDADGVLYVGDRTGSIFRVRDRRSAAVFATIPASVAAFHLAFGPDGWLYVTAPTLGARDSIYRVSPSGAVEVFYEGFGRPQGLAFDRQGDLYVVDGLAGANGVYRLRAGGSPEPEQVVSGGNLVGLAFDPRGGLALASSETVFRLSVPVQGFLRST
ncbi:MAG: SMP-30/gluconolactonase/LRE family protein [Acidobacteriota bacterium]